MKAMSLIKLVKGEDNEEVGFIYQNLANSINSSKINSKEAKKYLTEAIRIFSLCHSENFDSLGLCYYSLGN